MTKVTCWAGTAEGPACSPKGRWGGAGRSGESHAFSRWQSTNACLAFWLSLPGGLSPAPPPRGSLGLCWPGQWCSHVIVGAGLEEEVSGQCSPCRTFWLFVEEGRGEDRGH